MNIVIFLIGFILGVVLAFAVQFMQAKNSKAREEELYKRMQLEFENTAMKLLNNSSNEITAKNTESLDRILKQFKERIEYFEKQNNENARIERDKLVAFDNNIQTFIKAGNQIAQETVRLATMMKSDNRSSGKWGELVLSRVLEASGLREGKDKEFELQPVLKGGRPDAIVYLPDSKKVVIDAKTSIASWDSYLNAQSEEERLNYLKEFKDSMKNHINGLASRDYIDDNSFPYIMMFIPIESCYSLIFCDDCELWKYAWDKKVMPVSPSTLLASLRIVGSFMAIDRQNKNAQEIIKVCKGMLDKFAGLTTDLKKMRDNLDSAITKVSGKGNLMTQVEKLEKLGVKSEKDFQILEVIE